MKKTKQKYKTVFVGELVQKSSLSIGGNGDSAVVDNMLARDGLGRPILRGTGLAGALIATARRYYEELPVSITGECKNQAGDGNVLQESVWGFHNALILSSEAGHSPTFASSVDTEIRSGVTIEQSTGAASAGRFFQSETIAAGTRWWFCLEVDDYRETGTNKAAAIAANALKDWADGFCWLGRDVARGLGWLTLEGLKAIRLSSDDALAYPNAFEDRASTLDKLLEKRESDVLDHKTGGLESLCSLSQPAQRPRRIVGQGCIKVGLDATSDYGLDTLSSLHSDMNDFIDLKDGQLFKRGQDGAQESVVDEPDTQIMWTRPAGNSNEVYPLLAGSGIRGVWRHFLSWWYRSRLNIEIPTVAEIDDRIAREGTACKLPSDPVTRLFGSMVQSSRLLVSDALLTPDARYEVVQLEHHAEDEFAGSTFAASKFDRCCLVRGQFDYRFVVEFPSDVSDEEYDEAVHQLKLIDAMGRNGHLPLGGGQWRGHGWITNELEFLQVERVNV